MTMIQLVFLAVVFVVVFGGAIVAARLFTNNAVRDRLDALSDKPVSKFERGVFLQHLVNLASPLAKLSVPADGWETSAVRVRFITAGWRTPAAPGLFYAAKTGLALLLPLLVQLYLSSTDAKTEGMTGVSYLLVAAALGYYLPGIALSQVIKRRQREIFESFPDALDLMTVCVEAGLAMDAALARVAQEIGLKSLILAEELQLVTLELRAGSGKEKALRNLSLRTGVEDVDALVTMLIQAERFGTSIADSLRVQSGLLRTKRRQRAEEQAAKMALKLLFPLIFFIFPSLLVVLLGPAVLQLSKGLGSLTGT